MNKKYIMKKKKFRGGGGEDAGGQKVKVESDGDKNTKVTVTHGDETIICTCTPEQTPPHDPDPKIQDESAAQAEPTSDQPDGQDRANPRP